MTKKYKNPPINELVIGVFFNPPLIDFRSEHVGLFWSQIKNDYPVVEQQPPLRAFDFASPGEMFPMPRFWLISKGGEMLMQLQKSAFLFNWRKNREGGTYPHFESVKCEFDRFYDLLLAFLSKEIGAHPVLIEACEMSYVNVIGEGAYWKNALDTTTIIPSFSVFSPGFEGYKPPDFNSTMAFYPENDLSLSIILQTRRDEQHKKNALYFEIKASGSLAKPGAKSEADKWLVRAHDHIVETFDRLTSREIQDKYWLPLT